MSAGADMAGSGRITPWPAPAGADVVMVGGTFDPPHRAHVRVPERVRWAVAPAGWLVYVPAGVSPFKVGNGPRASAGDRVAMVRLALRGVERAVVWTDELDRGGTSYTVETLRRARAVAPGAAMRLLLGADQAAQFHRWREFREILAIAEPAVVLRPPLSTIALMVEAMRGAGVWTAEELRKWAGWVVMSDLDPVSSTGIRAALAAGGVVEGLDPEVERYVRERGLYGGRHAGTQAHRHGGEEGGLA